MSRCLVVGANGFIGSHLVDALAAGGHQVTAFDRFSRGAAAFTSSGVTTHVGDFLSHADLREALEGKEYVFHFLSTTSPAVADSEPTLDIRTNISQSVDLFDLCVASGVRKVYFASTGGAIYGDQRDEFFSEVSRTLPVSPYAIGKLAIENYLRYFRTRHALESVSLRISNPFGPRQHARRKQGLIPIALRQIVKNDFVTKYGSGSMTRDYIYVEDVARMIASMPGTDSKHEVYNIGSGIGRTVNQVLDAIRTVTQRDFEVREVPTPATFVERAVLDGSRFASEYGAQRLVTLEDGIERTWLAELDSYDEQDRRS
jgi:UDP-glucose 4-epimerase